MKDKAMARGDQKCSQLQAINCVAELDKANSNTLIQQPP